MTKSIDTRIQLIQGDITRLACDAIVTAANQALRGGGGVDGAVHNAAGPELVRASMALAPCPAGEARITDGFKLGAKFVIHAVGPIFQDMAMDRVTLGNAYRSCLALAAEHQIGSMAFPCISTGAYGFPPDAACEIAIDAVTQWLRNHELPEVVLFCCFEPADYDRYESRLASLGFLT